MARRVVPKGRSTSYWPLFLFGLRCLVTCSGGSVSLNVGYMDRYWIEIKLRWKGRCTRQVKTTCNFLECHCYVGGNKALREENR